MEIDRAAHSYLLGQTEYRLSVCESENERLRAALTTIKNSPVSGHVNYEPVREFIDRILKE
jgi:hypothetical protein